MAQLKGSILPNTSREAIIAAFAHIIEFFRRQIAPGFIQLIGAVIRGEQIAIGRTINTSMQQRLESKTSTVEGTRFQIKGKFSA